MSFLPLGIARACVVGVCTLMFAAIAPAQTRVFAPTITVEKRSTIRQISATSVVSEGSAFVVIVTFPSEHPAPEEVSLELRGATTTLELSRVTPRTYEYRRPFEDSGEMDRTIPDGTYVLETSKGTASINTARVPPLSAVRISNWEGLQQWNGRDEITVSLAPTPSALPYPGMPLSPHVAFSLRRGTQELMSASTALTSPTTSLTTNTPPVRFPVTSPGEVFDAEVTLGAYYGSLDGFLGLRGPSYSVQHGFTIKTTVARSFPPPVITRHPVPQTVNAGAPITLSVAADGSALTYSWMKDTRTLAGATNATLTIAAAQASDAGLYSVVVRNTGGFVESTPARVTVNALPPTISRAPAG